MNILSEITDKLTDGGFMFVLGILVVFLGMIIIILCVSLIGKLIQKFADAKKTKKTVQTESKNDVKEVSDDLTDEVKAAIIAAVSMYYFNTNKKCDFIVKKIKKL